MRRETRRKNSRIEREREWGGGLWTAYEIRIKVCRGNIAIFMVASPFFCFFVYG